MIPVTPFTASLIASPKNVTPTKTTREKKKEEIIFNILCILIFYSDTAI